MPVILLVALVGGAISFLGLLAHGVWFALMGASVGASVAVVVAGAIQAETRGRRTRNI